MQPLKRVRHPSGSDILFDAKWHQYKMGDTKLLSVSKILDKYFPFEEEKILALVSKKKQLPVAVIKQQWQRQALLGKNVHEYIECKLLHRPPPTFTLLMEKKKRDAAKAKDSAEEKGPSESPVLSELLHGEEELYLPVADAAVKRVQSRYHVLAVEQVIAAPGGGLAGTIDFIGVDKRDPSRLLIGDWKTSGSVNSNFRFGSFESPSRTCLRHLPNAKFYRYAMQVIIYGEILKREGYVEKGFFDVPLRAALAELSSPSSSPAISSSSSANAENENKKKSSTIKSVKKSKVKAEEVAAAASGGDAAPLVDLSRYHKGDFTLEYGIVQLSKGEDGSVEAEFKEVTEKLVLPPDNPDTSFNVLLKRVMGGE